MYWNQIRNVLSIKMKHVCTTNRMLIKSGELVNRSEEGMVAGWGQTGFFLPELRRMQNLRDDGEKVQIQRWFM